MLQGSLTVLAFGILYRPLSDTRESVPGISKVFLWALELYKRNKQTNKMRKILGLWKICLWKKGGRRKGSFWRSSFKGRKRRTNVVFGNLQPNMIVRIFYKIRYQNVFWDTAGALRRPMDTRWTGVTVHTLFQDDLGTWTWNKTPCCPGYLPSLTKGRMGPAAGHYCKEAVTGPLWFWEKGKRFSMGSSYLAITCSTRIWNLCLCTLPFFF